MANITPIGQSTPVKDKKKSTTAVIHNQGKLKSKAANLKQCFESDDDDNEEIGQRSAAAESDRSKSKIIYRREQALPTKKLAFICEDCGKSFKDKYYIKLHKRSHSGEKPHPCEDCGKSFTTSTNLILHKKIHSEERPFPCNQCDKSFKILPSLKDHIIRCHVVKDPMYESKVIEDDTEKFPCDRCPKYLTTKHSLKVHQLTHTGEKAFACDQCEKSFSLKFNLQVHQRRHLEEKTVTCKSCDQSFKTTADLYNHKWKKVNGVKTSRCQ